MPIRRTTIKTRQSTSINWPTSEPPGPSDFDVGPYEITSSQEILSEDGLTITSIIELPTFDDLVRYDWDGLHSWENGPKVYMQSNSITFIVNTIDIDTNTNITPQQIATRAAELGFSSL